MKTIGLILVLILPQVLAKPYSEEEMDLETLKWYNLFYEEAVALMELIEHGQGQDHGKASSKPSMTMTKILKANNPGPLGMNHPIVIKDEMKATKDIWDDFEWKGFGPSTTRPFTPFDFRIIG